MKGIKFDLIQALLCALALLTIVNFTSKASDFPRYLYQCPPQAANQWDSLQAIGANLIWNYRSNWTDLESYLNSLYSHGMQAVLRNAQSFPYWVEYYSQAQYMQYQADMEYDVPGEALDLWNENGTGYYYFVQNQGLDSTNFPVGGVSWHLDHNQHSAGIAFEGPKFTGNTSNPGLYNEWDPDQNSNIDTWGYRIYRHRISVAANLGSLPSSTPVFTLYVDHYNKHDTVLGAKTIAKTVGNFTGGSNNFHQFWVQDTSLYTDTLKYMKYRLDWPDNCDVWVDWIESMDYPRGVNLFWDAFRQDTSLDTIEYQCDSLENIYNMGGVVKIAAWAQQENSPRMGLSAYGVINDRIRPENQPPLLPALRRSDQQKRYDHFVVSGHPGIVDIYRYQLKSANPVGTQSELDSLARDVELGYEACGDTLPLRYLCQGSSYVPDDRRDPISSELRAQAFMALAHGAKGIGYYGYVSQWDQVLQAYKQIGLVDSDYVHSYSPYKEKWDAVQLVFNQLDAMGDTLLRLKREAAYCCTDPNYQGSIESIYFEDDDTDYIEVGQFHDSSDASQKYVILVNRRTNGDRHITVETDKTGTWALRDLYTQEQFISSTGDFKAIPFDSGEGRVFKLAEFNDWLWINTDHIILADTVTNTTETPNEIQVNYEPARGSTPIYATQYGLLKFGEDQTLDCHGLSTDSVVFTALEPEEGWLGLYFNGSGSSSVRDSLVYTRVEHTNSSAIRAYGGSYLYLQNSWVLAAHSAGISCNQSNLIMDSSSITNCIANGLVLSNSDAKIYHDSICYNGNYGGSGIYAAYESMPKIGDTHLSHNDHTGLSCMGDGSTPIMLRSSGYPLCGRNTIVLNSIDGVFANGGGYPYLGIDSTRQGLNSIYDNGGYEVNNGNTGAIPEIPAQYNWWGQNPQFYGAVDTSNALRNPPGDSFIGGSSFAHQNPSRGADGPSPGNANLTEANRLNYVGVELFLDGEYYAAIDTFDFVVNQFPGTAPARFALNHLVVCYREAEDYEGAVAYINSFLQPPMDTTLVPLALYHKVLNLARLQEYPAAIAIAGNTQLMSTMPQDLQEPLMIELGMMQKYGMQNVIVGNGVFQQFLALYPESPLAPIAAMELGIEWEPRGTSGSGAAAGIGTADLPQEYYLSQNHPNPFNPTTTITFGLPVAAWVKVEVFDIAGRLVGLSGSVTTPTTGYFPAGVHEVTFDGSDLPSGIYLVRLHAGDFSAVEKMVLLK